MVSTSQILQKAKADIPIDFNWRYYVDIHPDLMKAGITSEHSAKLHYALYGKKEGRLYKPQEHLKIASKIVSSTSKSIEQDKIILFVQWYLDDDTEINRLKCLKKNIDNSHIDHIHIFSDTQHIDKILPIINTSSNISISFISDRLSYKTWMDYANQHYPHDIKVLINSDIYLDSTIQAIQHYNYNRHNFYAITRKDLSKEGIIQESRDVYAPNGPQTNHLYSHDCWIYKDPIKLSDMGLSKLDLKLGYNNCDRLLYKFLTDEKVNFINVYPDINAIHIDYRTVKSHQEYNLNYTPQPKPNYDIEQYLDYQTLTAYKNQLECICLLATGKEAEDGQLIEWLNRINNSIRYYDPNIEISKKLDLIILTNKASINAIETKLVSDLFRDIKIIDMNIPEQYNFYHNFNDKSDLIYGYKSGPNYTFFHSFQHLRQYNTTMFLECDCYLSEDWLERLYQYSQYSGPFWISGATYDGYNMATYHDIANQHLNGGVCLYATGCDQFISFMQFCFNLLPEYVKHYLDAIPYDYLIYKIIEDYFNYDDNHKHIWQFIKRQYIVNNLIYNYSTSSEHDVSTSIASIKRCYNFAVVHKKKK